MTKIDVLEWTPTNGYVVGEVVRAGRMNMRVVAHGTGARSTCHIHGLSYPSEHGCPKCVAGLWREPLSVASRHIDETPTLYGSDAERARREAGRRYIDRLLAEDARRFPAFAAARLRAVIGVVELCRVNDREAECARDILHELHTHEERRGGERRPRAATRIVDAVTQTAIEMYEEARGR